jgi:signal peptide peptidase SppA
MEAICEIIERKLAGLDSRDFERNPKEEKDYKVYKAGSVAVVPVTGVLMRRAGMLERVSGATSMMDIRRMMTEAMAMEGTKAVMLKFDSPGGEVTGTAETGRFIRQMAQSSPKPVVAFTEDRMASAAYWLASQADRVYATSDAITGSIGIVARIMDTSRLEKNAGLDMHVLRTGPNKAAGVGAVTDEQLAVYRELRDEAFAEFVNAVEGSRRMKLSDDVLTGRIYSGQSAVKAGLVDQVASFEEVISSYS